MCLPVCFSRILKFLRVITPVKKLLSSYILQWFLANSILSVTIRNPDPPAFFILPIMDIMPHFGWIILVKSITANTGGSSVCLWKRVLSIIEHPSASEIIKSSSKLFFMLAILGYSERGLISKVRWELPITSLVSVKLILPM